MYTDEVSLLIDDLQYVIFDDKTFPNSLHVLLSQQRPETSEYISSSESPLVEDLSSESVFSFTSASSLPLLRRDRPFVYQSTLTLQRISSLLTDGENQSREEEEEEEEEDESRTPSSVDVLLDCSELTATLDGTTDPISLSNLNKDILVELMLSGEGKCRAAFSLHTIYIKK